MENKKKISLKTTLDGFVGEDGWREEGRRKKISCKSKQLESRLYYAIIESGYIHKTLEEFKKYAESLRYGMASFAHIDKKSMDYFNNKLKRNGIEPIIPRLNKMDEENLSHVEHWRNYGLYGRDYLKYNGLTRKNLYKRN